MRILLFLLDLFFSRSRCFKDEEMNRFSKRGDPIENRRTPDASKRSIQRRRTSSSKRMRKPSFTERQNRKHARSARVKKRFTRLQKYARTREREREKEKEMNPNDEIVKKTTTTSHKAHPLSHLSARRTTLQTGCSCATGGRWRGFRSLLRRLRRTVSGSTRAG